MKPTNRYFKVIQAADVPEIYIYDYIGDDMFGGISDKMFAEELGRLKGAKRIDIRVNSPGGNAFQGHAIYNLLRSHPAHKRVFVDGLAASIMSEIILAGDEIEIASNGRIMIHQARGGFFGTADEMENYAKLIHGINEDLIQTYASRGGATADEFRAMIQKDTYFTADEAVELKLADRVGPKLAMAACITPDIAARLQLENVPDDLMAEESAEPEPEPTLTFENAMRRRINTLKTRS